MSVEMRKAKEQTTAGPSTSADAGTAAGPTPRTPARRVFADRDARLYLGGQITSMIGDSSLWLAIGIWVKSLTGSSSAAALTWFAFILGGLTGPFTSVLVDRLPLARLLVVTNLASAADVLVLLFVHDKGQAWIAYPVMFGYGVSYALLNAGTSALVKPMFGTELLAAANATLATAKQSMNLIAPLLGAGALAAVGAGPVIVADALSFVVAAGALWLVRARLGRADAHRDDTRRGGAWAVLSAGMRHILGTPAIRRVVLAVSVAILGLGFLEPAEFSVNSQGLHRAPEFMGWLFGFQGAGSLLGGLFAARAVHALGEWRTAAAGLAGATAGIALMAVPSLPVVLVAFTGYGMALTWVVVAQQTQLQRLTPGPMQGRAAGAANLLTKTPQATGIAVGSAVIGMTGYIALLGLIAGLTGTAALSLLVPRGE
ncbi:MAG: MFS transporter [Catenulispora sp.]|nr:MFS transporter [Catenulispora sp.]